jgi:hypothetical protein
VRYALFLIALAGLMSAVSAQSFSGWVLDGGNISVANVTFLVRTTDTQGSALILTPNSSVVSRQVLSLNSTEESQGWLFTYTDRKDSRQEYLDKYNITQIHDKNATNYSFSITIERLSTTAAVTKKVSNDKKISYHDLTNLSIELTNKGGLPLHGSYVERLPDYFEKSGKLKVSDGKSTSEYHGVSDDKAIEWNGNLGEGETVTLIQELRLIGTVAGSDHIDLLNGTFIYEGTTGNGTITTKATELLYYHPLTLTMKIELAKLAVDVQTKVRVTLKNDAMEPIEVDSLTIMHPASILAEARGGLSPTKEGGLTWHGDLDPGADESFDILVTPLRSGVFTFNSTVLSTYRGIQHTTRTNLTGTATINRPTFTLSAPAVVAGGRTDMVNVSIVNQKTGFVFSDLALNITSDLFDSLHYVYETLGDSGNIKQQPAFTAPATTRDIIHNVTVRARYESAHGEAFTEEINRSINVKAANFTKEINTSFYNYTMSFDNRTAKLIFDVNQSGNLSDPTVLVGLFGKDTPLPLGANRSEITVTVPVNTTLGSGVLRTKYREGGVLYFYDEQFKVVNRMPMKYKNTTGNGSVVLTNKTNPFEYVKGGGRQVQFTVASSNSILIGIVAVLGAFSIVIFIAVLMRKGKGAKLEGQFDSFTKVEEMDSIEQHPVVQVTERRGYQLLGEQVPLPTTNLEILEDYIRRSREAGKSAESIKDSLIKNGWLSDIVEVYLR